MKLLGFQVLIELIALGLLFKNQSMKLSMAHPVKMLDFISDLYKRYKVLNKLGEKQSLDFQREVVTMLVDSKQNVDKEIYSNVVEEQGLEGFVLDVLGKVINRTPFKNQFELNRNLATITENIKKEQEDLQKKHKILERKQEKIKALEDSLMTNIKQKVQSFQNQSIQKIMKKETQIKKNITLLLNQLKAKEKLVLQRYEQTKSNSKMLCQLEQKEKSINEKMKVLEKKEKQLKQKEGDNEASKREGEIQQCRQQVERMRENLKEATKRYKNLELAYKKLKNDKDKIKEIEPKVDNIPKLPFTHNKNQIQIDELQLSRINQNEKNNQCQQLISYINIEEVNGKLQSIKKLLSKSEQKNKASQIDEIKQLLNIKTTSENETIQISPSSSVDSESEEEEENYMPKCLSPTVENNIDDTLKQLRSVPLQEDKEKLQFVKQNTLQRFINICYESNTPHQLCEAILQKILELIEESTYYMDIITYLASDKVVQFLQHIYLSHETNTDIIETTTLILSRIKLRDFELKLSSSFLKALQIRMKVENKGSFLFGNIHFILN